MAATSSSTFLRQMRPAAVALVAFTVLFGVAYPLVELAIGQVAFHEKANGSLIEVDGTVVGSSLIGQGFAAPEYFHPRPSAAGSGYDGAASSGSNLGPTNPDYLALVQERAVAYREENGLADDAEVPADAVTASASGLDPHISLANAQVQAPRVAETRGMPLDEVLALIDEHTDDRPLGVLGDPGVNVLQLNLALNGVSG
jgi:potassium-transporting ATPase KdpC subunit